MNFLRALINDLRDIPKDDSCGSHKCKKLVEQGYDYDTVVCKHTKAVRAVRRKEIKDYVLRKAGY